MPRLRPARSALIEGALADARAGTPRLLRIEGASGMGKTLHLRAALTAATGFRVLEVACDESPYRPAYGVLERLGIARTVTDGGAPHRPAVAAQSLRRLIDDESRDEPLVIAIDDAQWADPESLDALRLVLEGVSGDRLLVVIAGRPPSPAPHATAGPHSWQRFRDMSGANAVLTLDGIDLGEAAEIVREAAANSGIANAGIAGSGTANTEVAAGTEVANDTVERLWRHTERNPMYLRSLVTQYPLVDLAAMTDLPAPVEVARELNGRLASMHEDAGRLLRAIAVVGTSWVDRLDAAAIAGIDDSSAALEVLVESGLLVVRESAPLADVRVVHALVHAAVYQSIPIAERRAMHASASELLISPMQRLEHAVAAADRRDDALADQLEQAAALSHGEGDYRREARLWHWASQLSASVVDRERRWLEYQLATVLTHDTRLVRANLSEIAWADDVMRRTVVMAWLLIIENRIADARRVLEAPSPETVASADPLTRERLLVLKAWTMLVSGYATESIRAVIEALPTGRDLDPATRPYYLRTAGQVAARESDFDHVRRDFEAAPSTARDTPMEDTDRLSWRGAVYSLCGFAAEARRDLSEVVSRVRGGRIDAASGVNHALYGLALWHDGELERASIELQSATGFAVDRLHPLVQVVQPLVPAVRGDFERADALLSESEAVLRDLPWHEAVSVLAQAQVVRLHAGGDASARASYLSRLRSGFGSGVTSASNPVGAIWHLHIALARIWAGELDEVEPHLVGIETDMIVPDWAAWCRLWLTGLRSEGAGELETAHRLLREAVAACNAELPLYRGHVHADLARVCARIGDAEVEAASASQARLLYADLGAAPYLDRLAAHSTTSPPLPDPLEPLSNREREIAALLLAGFSYAQIAEELYVTRSTVGFHLGNIYAKTGVGSRHELIRLVRDRG
ncbi:MAG: AAA family ATPase [Leucobacter sp.]